MTSHYTLDLDAALGFFERTGIRCLVNPERTEIAVPNPDREGWSLRILPRPEQQMMALVYPLPGAIPEDRIDALVVAANQLNARTPMGAWVLNTAARELAFRVTLRTQGVLYDDAGLRGYLQMVVGAVEARIDYLDAVLKGEPPT